MQRSCIRRYTKKITFESLSSTATTDAHGFIDPTAEANWTTFATAFADCTSKGGKEFWKVHKVRSDVTHVWTCQYSATLASVTPSMRLVYEDENYEIISVINIDLNNQEIEFQTQTAG